MSTKYGPVVEPGFFGNLDVVRLLTGDERSRSVLLVLIELRAFSMGALTDGFIPSDVLRAATRHPDPESAMVELVARGLAWEVEGGWQIDWSSQLSAEKIAATTKRLNDWDAHKVGDHTNCDDHPNYHCHKNGDLAKWKKEHPPHGIRTESSRQGSARNPRSNSTQLNPTQPNEVERVEELGRDGRESASPPSAGAPGATPPKSEKPGPSGAGAPVADDEPPSKPWEAII